ncbi:SdpI family protein [Thermococcus sp. MAR1]|uniref:SdpI family protein n=1 Tax=Thermococcus sp. MAR1 TaxID=1638263 RepID=UPI0014391DA1|nr:SdpI family protein [Thermococcus sp. MAR1]NJE11234.1 SdpI family protein [Thermococcus sp. MAR1]
MEPYTLFRIIWATFLGLGMIAAGVITFTSKGEPGIGFRIGYTYLSERARRKANRVSGIGTILTGVFLIILSPFLSFPRLAALLLLGIGTTMLLAYLTAKREYELEEFSEKAPEKPGKVIKPPDLKKYIALQAAFLAIFTGLCIAGRVPQETAIVLGGALILLLALTFLVSRPLVFQLAPKFKGVMAKRFAKALTLVSGLMTAEIALAALGYEPGPLGVVLLIMASLGVIFYATFIALAGAYEEGYY